jgi:lipopolysaccharide biosynthesis regulator YciM
MSAGVLDRAEQLFLEILANSSPHEIASKQLLNIYQKEKKWLQAIEMAKNIQRQTQQSMGSTIAQFYCEMAEHALSTKPDDVPALIKQAQLYDPNCIRATLLAAEQHIKTKNFRKALKKLKLVEDQDPQYLPEALPKLEICYQEINALPAFEDYLITLLERYPDLTSIRIMLTTIIKRIDGERAAQDFLYQQLKTYPSIEGLHTLLSLGELSPDIIPSLLSNISHKLTLYSRRYSCQHCGFSAKTMHWHCPSCKQWGTIRPTEIHLPALANQVETSS